MRLRHGMDGALGSFRPYPAYKDSWVEWLGDVPEHWEVRRLRFSLDLNPLASELKYMTPETEVSFVPMEAIGEFGGLELSMKRTRSEVEGGYTYFRDGDVLVAQITPCFENGKGALASGLENGVGFGTTELQVLRPGQELDRKFLLYITFSDAFRRLGQAEMYGAGGQKRVPGAFVENFEHPHPPLAEQRAIAAFLDRETARIDALVAKNERLVELLQEKRAALITHAVTKGLDPEAEMKDSGVEWLGRIPAHWEVKPLKRLGDLQGGAGFPEGEQGLGTEEIPFFKVGDMGSAENRRELGVSQHTISRDTARRLNALVLPPGTVVFAKVGAALRLNRRRIVVRPSCIDNNMMGFIPAYCDTDWAMYWLTGLDLGDLANPGAVPSVNEGQMRDIAVIVPPVPEQRVIASFLDLETARIDEVVAKIREAIERLKELRTALISAAVTGRIDVREEAA
ncbi:MAG: restriction endonuclease subunit S [Caulobacteraceae bacterium]